MLKQVNSRNELWLFYYITQLILPQYLVYYLNTWYTSAQATTTLNMPGYVTQAYEYLLVESTWYYTNYNTVHL